MKGLHKEPDDTTPLTPEEREGLIPSHVTLRLELNELEQQNILKADSWALARRRNPIDEAFGRRLHRRMFGDVWRWAGAYRTTNKNLGVSIGRRYRFGSTTRWKTRATGSSTRRIFRTK